jgi:hypothetical protein
MLKCVNDEIDRYKIGINRTAMRYLISELVSPGGAPNSFFWQHELHTAFYALALGHVEEFFKPEPKRRQGHPVKMMNWKLKALFHVYFHVGKGLKKYRARELVGDKLGQSTETLRSWEKLMLGDHDSMTDLRLAKLAGEMDNDKHSIEDLVRKGLANTTDIWDVKVMLADIRRTPLDKIRAGIRSSRDKKSGI